jgi:thiol-disulfide isomerase/thioredoxin
LQEIKPTECEFKSQGCPHVGLHRNREQHAESCLFNLPLITRAAVNSIESEDYSAGFELKTTLQELEEYAGEFRSGPSRYMDDDEEEWFHRMDRENKRIIRIKYVSQRWVLSIHCDPEDETEILTGSESENVAKANFQGFTMTPLTTLTWDENQAAGKLAADSIKLMYFGGMWCPYCPPFTERLKLFYDIVWENIGPKCLEVIFVSSDRDKADMLEYYGRHHGDWFAVPYEERELKERLGVIFGMEGIPSLHVIGNDGKEVEYFSENGGGDIGSAIRKLPTTIKDAKNAAIELFKQIQQRYVVDQQGFLGLDYDHILQSVKKARVGENVHANLLGELKDLKNGNFSHAARGLRAYLKVDDEWKEDMQCTSSGIQEEVRRLIDCPDCAALQASVLQEMNRNDEAQACRSLADALQSLQAQARRVKSLHAESARAALEGRSGSSQFDDAVRYLVQERERVESIRRHIKDTGGWYYGSQCSSVDWQWPPATVQYAYGAFRQPLCHRCKKYRLDCKTSHSSPRPPRRKLTEATETLQDFAQLTEATEAKLTLPEVASLRFYTSHSFGSINEALRSPDSEPHPLPAIATNIQNGLKKLRSLGAEDKSARETVILWRGFRDTQSTEEFMDAGGTELAPMSTTADVGVAVGYAVRNSTTCRSLLFRIVTDNNLQRGADLKWLSMFPGEAETLFPPLTYLQSTGRHQVVREGAYELSVVEVKATLP